MKPNKIAIFDKFITNNKAIFLPNRIELRIYLTETIYLKEKNTNKYKQFTINRMTKKYECVTENEICEITPENMVLQYDAIPRDISIENQIIQIIETSKNSENIWIKKE